MSTKIYTLTFAGAGTQSLPQGRFFLVKSASSALSMEARKRNGQPVTFENVGAGLTYNALDSDKWYELVVTSTSAQIVEVVVSDDANVTFASGVTVLGGVSVTEQPSSALASQAKTALATGGSVDIAANLLRRAIVIQNWSDSAGNFCVRDQSATTDAGEEIQAGMARRFYATCALRIRNNSGVSVNYSWNEES